MEGYQTPWLPVEPRGDARLRLFCFPYAGGGAVIYRNWQEYLPDGVDVCPVQLPGRGRRMGEPLATDFQQLLDAAAQALLPLLGDKPFAFFGHSMGAILAFELARKLLLQGGPNPLHLFVSGREAVGAGEPQRSTLPDDEFLEELRGLNGTPGEVLENPELLKLVFPILRADFAVCESYVHRPAPVLSCPIAVYGGLGDGEIDREKLDAWRDFTTAGFSCHMFPGDHFFIDSAKNLVLRTLALQLLNIIDSLA